MSIKAVLIFWLMLPNLGLLWLSSLSYWETFGLMTFSWMILSLAAVFVSTWQNFFLLNFPLAICSGLIASYTFVYQNPITIGLMHAVFETNFGEIIEVFQRQLLVTFIWLTGCASYLLLTFKLGNLPIKRRSLLLALGVWSVIVVIYHPYAIFELHERFHIVVNRSFIQHAFPYNLIETTYEVWRDRNRKDDQTLVLPKIRITQSDAREVFILIIGESVREASFTEVGVEQHWFSKFRNLVYYPDVLAQANFTSLSVDMLLTGAKQPDQINGNPTLLHWQKAAGCWTVVLSNNTSNGFNRIADINDTKGDSGVTHYTRFDHDFLPIIKSLIRDNNRKKLCITLHMVGSHANYTARYDKKFSKYPLIGSETDKLRAAYKNTIVSLQDFLNQLIRIIDVEETRSFLAFTSDHGENLREINNLIEHVTMTPTRYELRVPIIFWANANFISENNQKWQKLYHNRDQPTSNAHLLPTFLDSMGILEQARVERQLSQSLFGSIRTEDRAYVTPDFRIHGEQDILK